MKKTLVALAALAATGAFAQVTVTGEFAYGYQAATTGGATTSDAAGWGVDTSYIQFDANEDLGGGYKMAVKMSMNGLDRSGGSADYANYPASGGANYVTGRSGPVIGTDAGMTLTMPFGVLNFATKKNADYLSTTAGLGALWYGLDGKVMGSRVRRDQWSFTMPVGPVKVSVGQQEAANLMGLGMGGAGNAQDTAQRVTAALDVAYANGPIKADFQYLPFDARVDNSPASQKEAYRLSGSYDFGMAQVGLGMERVNSMADATVTQSMLGVSVPVGALTLAGNWAQKRTADAPAGNGTKSGYGLQAQYNLSKRTYLIGAYDRWDAAVGDANASSQYNFLMVHDF